MNHQSRDSRRRAARNFVNALDELETVLKSESSESPAKGHPKSGRDRKHQPRSQNARPDAPKDKTDFGDLLDEAVQDIEQFMAADDAAPKPERQSER